MPHLARSSLNRILWLKKMQLKKWKETSSDNNLVVQSKKE